MRRLPLLISLGVVVTAALLCSTAEANFAATVVNSTNTYGTGTQFTTINTGDNSSTMCTSVPASGSTVIPATSAFDCVGNLFAPTTDTNTTAKINLTRTGTTLPPNATIQGLFCRPVSGVNLMNASMPVIPRNGFTLGSFAGPKPGGTAMSVTGQSTDAASVGKMVNTAAYTQSIWFKTSSAVSLAGIMGFRDTAEFSNSTTNDHGLSIDSAGKLTFYDYLANNQHAVLTSSMTLNDGAWHFAVITVTDSSTVTMSMYIDGALNQTTTFSQSVWYGNSYVHLGSTGLGQPVEGAVSNAALWNRALTAADILNLYNSSNQAIYSSRVTTLGPTNYWPLTDDGYTSYAGPYPALGARSPCEYAELFVYLTNYCLFPSNGSGGCVGSYNLNEFTSAPIALPVSGLGVQQTISLQSDRRTAQSWVDGLLLSVPVKITQVAFNQTFTWAKNRVVIIH